MDENQTQPKLKNFQQTTQMANMTQEQIARDLGVSLNTVNGWFNNKKMPKTDNFFALCRKLKMSPKSVAQLLHIDITDIPDDHTD